MKGCGRGQAVAPTNFITKRFLYMGLELVESPVREKNLTIGQATIEDVQNEPSLRPKSLDEYIGQAKIVNNLKIFLKAALRRSEALDHCLFFGPPGLGKTSLAV